MRYFLTNTVQKRKMLRKRLFSAQYNRKSLKEEMNSSEQNQTKGLQCEICIQQGKEYKCAKLCAMVRHKQREHSMDTMQRKYTNTPWCPFCLSMIFTISKSKIHLRDSKNCAKLAELNFTPMTHQQVREVDKEVTISRKELAKKFHVETKAINTATRIEGPMQKMFDPPRTYEPTPTVDWQAMSRLPSWPSAMVDYDITYQG